DAATQVATTGAGSPGNETTYFGSLTKAAVIKFQNKYASEVLALYGLTAGTGYFGSTSRAKANALIAAGTGTGTGTLPEGCTSTSGYSPTTGQPCSGTGTGTGTGTGVTAGFSIALASTNPASGTLIQKQATANLLEFTVNNGTSSEVKITSVELTRLGVSADATLANVYLFDGASRLTDAGTVSSGKVTFSNGSGVIVIPANSTKTVSVKSDIADVSAGQTVGVSLSGITSGTTLSNTTLPIAGNIFNIANATLATVTVGAVTPGDTFVDPANDVKVWESTFNISKNVVLSRLSLKQINSIDPKDIKNFRLLINGTQVAQVESLDANNFVTFVFDKTLTSSSNIKVLADIIGGSGRIAQFSLRNVADIDVKDAEYGVNITIAYAVSGSTGTITINPGNLIITKSTTSPSGTTPNNGTGVVLARFDFKAYGEVIKVENLKPAFTYTPAGANAAASLRNARILVNGQQVGSTITLPEAGPATPISTNFEVQPGETAVVEIVADIYDIDLTGAIVAGDAITAKLLQGTANGSKKISYTIFDVPTAGQAAQTIGNALIVSEGTLTAVKTTAYANQTTVAPQAGYKLASWDIAGSNTEDINLNTLSITIATAINATFDKDDLTNLYVKYGDQTTSIKSVALTTNEWSISYTLPKNGTLRVELYGDIGAAANITDGDAMKAQLLATGTGVSSTAIIRSNSNVVVDGQVIAKNTGTLTASRDASTPNTELLDDTGAVKTVSYKFEAVNDSYLIVEATVTIADPSVVSAVKIKDGSSVLATRAGAAQIVFTGLAIPVSANTSKVLDIELDLASVGYGAGNSGANIQARLTGTKVRVNSTGQITATVTGVPATIGNAMYVYKAIPTVSLVSLPTATLVAGTNTLSKFSINSGATGTIAWKEIKFTVNKSGVDANSPAVTAAELWEVNSNTKVAGTGAITTLAAANADGSILFTADNEQLISGEKTYELRVTVTDADGVQVGEYVNARIPSDSTAFRAPNKFANAKAAKDVTTLGGLAYTDSDTNLLVTDGDTRLNAVSKYTTVTVVKANTVVGHNSAAKIQKAYGIPAGFVMTLAEGTTDDLIGAATFTVAGVSGLTCTPYTNTNYTGAITVNATNFNAIKSVECLGNGMQLGITGITVVEDDDGVASTGTLTITVTKAIDYAVDSVVVGATDSDVNLVTVNAAAASFTWSDVSAQSHAEATYDWSTDFLVKNLPTATQNLSK
ncbi:MAG: hypothetical protein PHV98_06965, partial [Candidatus Omnitrophica bacterium]|nr:hypothetical protein [Candidatus Omnitrophota bacterium]